MAKKKIGFSIITCTKRQEFIHNLFKNYRRQRYLNKELIIVINKDSIDMGPYREMAMKYKNVQVYRLPEKQSLGRCLNFAVTKAKYSYIAKFDDDDYYAPNYLKENKQTFNRTNADIVGKSAHFMYLRGARILILRFRKEEHRYVSSLPGATIVFKRKVFRKCQFPDRNVGEDTYFCLNSKAKGFKIYSAGKYNFAAIRRKNSSQHTWIISDKKLLDSPVLKFPRVRNFKKYVRRKV